jgi:AraC-like DNA-binding protein
MSNQLAEALLRFTDGQPGESPFMTPIDGLAILRSDLPNAPRHRLSRPAMCIVAQGVKWASFGGNRVQYRAGQALVIGVETPSIGRVVEASPGEPCLVLAFELDLAVMRSVADELADPPMASGRAIQGVLVADFQGPLADCALRLVRLLETPKAIATLYPGLMREICYWLLTGPHGADIARLALKSSPSQPLIRALHALQARFREMVRVEELAAIAQMSPSAFHRQFKALTSLAPLQYQKQLRLHEARRLMVARAFNGEAAAFEVGYESASQFSREYARLFGSPPKRDLQRLRSVSNLDAMPQDAVAITRDAA